MPAPRFIARANRFLLNPIARRFAGRFPPFLLVRHVGRSSGRHFETPIFAFRHDDGFIVALTYGPDTDWLRNLEAAGRCEAVYRRQTYLLSDGEIVHSDPQSQPLPGFIQWALRLLNVRDFLIVEAKLLP
jgi:deazaflavin-dependent oxidoreductase (nitroreductase family)